jgi:hypothetical protein
LVTIDALEQAAVLTINRQNPGRLLPGRALEEFPTDYQGFLVCQRQALPRTQGSEAWAESCSANQAIENKIRFALSDLFEPLRTDKEITSPTRPHTVMESAYDIRITDRDRLG